MAEQTDSSLHVDFTADRPIKESSQDRLERGQFAAAVAEAIAGWKGNDSLTLAIYGPWGTGKSSVKNLILERLKACGTPPTVVEFNPWAWSGQDQLLTAFFNEIAAAISSSTSAGPNSQALATKWRRYGAHLALGGTTLGAMKHASMVLAIPWLPLLLGSAETVAKKTAELSAKAAEAHEAASAESPPLEVLKEQLASELENRGRSILVVLDDIDRLRKEEVRLLFQLIKVNADFPRVIYLLLCDRKVAEQALDDSGTGDGREYMKKIVQCGFDLPRPSQTQLDSILFEGLNLILSQVRTPVPLDNNRWSHVYHSAIRRYLTSLRSINRFLPAVQFAMGLFIRNRTFEVDLVDLICVEAIREFEPDVYHRLARERDFLLGAGPSAVLNNQQRSEAGKQRLKTIIEEASHSEAIERLLHEMFPRLQGVIGGYKVAADPEWTRQLRICEERFFDRYFRLDIGAHDLPHSRFRHLMSLFSDGGAALECMRQLEVDGLLREALNRLHDAHLHEIPSDAAEEFLRALFKIGDSVDPRGRGVFDIGPVEVIRRIINMYLLRDSFAERRAQLALDAIAETDALNVPSQLVRAEVMLEGRGDRLEPRIFNDTQLNDARLHCGETFARHAANGLIDLPDLAVHLWTWRAIAGDEPVRAFVRHQLQNRDAALKFIRSMVSESHAATGNKAWVEHRVRLVDVERFADIEQLKTVLSGDLAETIAPPDETFVIPLRCLRTALKARERGESEED